jgi:hypothetical protein
MDNTDKLPKFLDEIGKIIKATFGNRNMERSDRTADNYAKAKKAVFAALPELATKHPVISPILEAMVHKAFDAYAFTNNIKPNKGLIDYNKRLKADKALTRGEIEQNTTGGLAYNHSWVELVNTSPIPMDPTAIVGDYIDDDKAAKIFERNMLAYAKQGAGFIKLTNPDLRREQKRLKKAAKATANVNGNEAHVAG